MQLYRFEPKSNAVYITAEIAKLVLDAVRHGKKQVEIPLNLGRKRSLVTIVGNAVELPQVGRISVEELSSIINDNDNVYAVTKEKNIYPITMFSNRKFYKLKSLGPDSPPTLEISGIHMHNIVGTTPISDAARKIRLARIRQGHKVLDVCTGLGYTAIAALLAGSSHVVTIEKDVNVLKIAEHNPWSWELANPRITIILGNAVDVLEAFRNSCFDRAIHDPPRFKLAGELYSLHFYELLFSVLKPGAYLFHYTGAPKVKRGFNIQKGIAERLQRAGFRIVKRITGYGIVARKPV